MIRMLGLFLGSLVAPIAIAGSDDPISAAIRDCVANSNGGATRIEIGSTAEGRPIEALALGGAARGETTHPALLILAGLDGRHRVGMEVAVGIASRWLADASDVWSDASAYVIPCLNRDAFARTLAGTQPPGFGGALDPDDADHDGYFDEDGPVDLNGDGVISWMRVFHPPAGTAKTHLIDPEEPRLSRVADATLGERATHCYWIEGTDQDGDRRFSEDPVGGVDFDRNFPHHWPEHQSGAGEWALSAVETRALVDWLLDRDDIMAALVLSTSDNVRNSPEKGKQDVTGRAPAGIEKEDGAYYDEVKRRYEATVGKRSATKAPTDGACHAWLYAQYGIPTFQVDLSRDRTLEPAPGADATSDGDTDTDKGSDDASAGEKKSTEEAPPKGATDAQSEEEPSAGPPNRRRGGGAGRGGRRRRGDGAGAPGAAESVTEGTSPGKNEKGDRKRPAVEKDELDWLKYFDQTGEGFVPFTPFTHPILGEVEIGGEVIGSRVNPPDADRDTLIEKHAAFATELLTLLPRVEIGNPTLEAMGGGVWRARVVVTNEGYFPSIPAIGERVRRVLPPTFRIEIPEDRILVGNRLQSASSVTGSGGEEQLEWWFLGDPGDVIEWTLRTSLVGERKIRLPLRVEAK